MSEERDIVERLRDARYGAVPSQRSEAADEIVSLRIELDGSATQAANYRAQIEDLRLQLASARKALEPFSKIAEFVDSKSRDNRPLIFGVESRHAAQLTIGDIRRAAASYTDEQGEPSGVHFPGRDPTVGEII